MKRPDDAKCRNCVAWQGIAGGPNGECRYAPPKPWHDGKRTLSLYPATHEGEWCCEFSDTWEDDDAGDDADNTIPGFPAVP